jgi:HEAT repeat protein
MEGRDRESILEDLHSTDEEVRRLAVERLTALPSLEAVPALVERLGDPSWRVRKAAIDRLAESVESTQATRLLIAALGDADNTSRRNAALEALMRCGREAVPSLIEASHTLDADVRKQVVDALGGIGKESAADRLVEMLGDPDPNVRGAAADALGAVGSPISVSALLTAAREDEERLVCLSALLALVRMEAPVAASEVGGLIGIAMLRPAVLALLGYSDDPDAFDWLLKGAADGSRRCREASFEALVRWVARSDPAEAERLADRIREAVASAPEILPDALQRLSSAGLQTQLTLVQFLGLLERPDTAVALLLAGSDEALTEVVLSTLEGFGTVLEGILDEAWESLESDSRCLVCDLLGRVGRDVAQARLISTLPDPDVQLRIAAARALGQHGRGSSLPELVRRLEAAVVEDEDAEDGEVEAITEAIVTIAGVRTAAQSEVIDQAIELLDCRREGAGERFRLAAARIMGHIGRPEDAASVAFMLSDPSAAVRRAAVEALARVARGKVPEPLRMALADEAPVVRIAAALALGASDDPRAVDDLANLASDEDAHVRAAAMRALGRSAATGRDREPEPESEAVSRAFVVLSTALEDKGSVAMAALEALTALGGPEAAQVAAPMLDNGDPELVKAAVACVRAHGDADALRGLFPLISHDHWLVRFEATQALADRRVERAVPAMLRWLEKEQDGFVRDALLNALKRLET